MDQKFHDIYKDLSEFYRVTFYLLEESVATRSSWPFRESGLRLSRIASEVVEEAVSKAQLTDVLRADAKQYLLVVLHQTILLPIAHRESGEDLRELVDDIRADTLAILKAAEADRVATGKRSITVLHLTRTIVTLWDTLKINLWDIWG